MRDSLKVGFEVSQHGVSLSNIMSHGVMHRCPLIAVTQCCADLQDSLRHFTRTSHLRSCDPRGPALPRLIQLWVDMWCGKEAVHSEIVADSVSLSSHSRSGPYLPERVSRSGNCNKPQLPCVWLLASADSAVRPCVRLDRP